METLHGHDVSMLIESLHLALEHTNEQRPVGCGELSHGGFPQPEVFEGFGASVSMMKDYQELMGQLGTLNQHRPVKDDDVWRLLAEVHQWICRSVYVTQKQQTEAGRANGHGSR